MNILYIANNVSLPGNNGGTVHAHEVAKGLQEKGHRVFLVCEMAHGQKEFDVYEDMPIIRISRLLGKLPYIPFSLLYKVRYFYKFIDNFDFVMERNSLFGGVGKVLALKWKVPYLLEVNTAIYDELFLKRKVENKLTKNLVEFIRYIHFKTVDHVIGTHFSLIPKFAHPKFTLTIWGVNTSKFDISLKNSDKVKSLREQYNIKEKFNVLISTSDSKSKGLKLLVDIIDKVSKMDENICFLIVGVEINSNLYKELDERGLIKFCIFTGKVQYDDVEYYMAMGDIGLATYSKVEHKPYIKYDFFGIPIKVLEYQSLGLPVVGPNIGNMKKTIIDNQTGHLVEESNVDAFSDAIVNLKNDSLFDIKQKKSREFAVEKLDWKHHIEQLEQLIYDMKNECN